MSWTLLIDCSLPGVAVGITEGNSGKCLERRTRLPSEGSSTQLAPMVQEILRVRGHEPAEITQILISVGPGSFTGIRMGLSFVFGLHAALPDLKVVGASSMVEMARADSAGGSTWVLPGTRKQGFWIPPIGDFELRSPASFFLTDWIEEPEAPGHSWTVCGRWSEFEERVADGKLKNLCDRELLEHSLDCLAKHTASLNWSSTNRESQLPIPLYLRDSTAEEKLKQSEIQLD